MDVVNEMGNNIQGTDRRRGEEEERTNHTYATVLTFLIYIEMLHLPESRQASFASSRHRGPFHLRGHGPHGAGFKQ